MITMLNGPRRKRQCNRRNGYNMKVRHYAPDFQALQDSGYVSVSAMCQYLNSNCQFNSKGKPWAESTIYGMLKRGKELGIPLILRSRSEAASSRINLPRPPRPRKRQAPT